MRTPLNSYVIITLFTMTCEFNLQMALVSILQVIDQYSKKGNQLSTTITSEEIILTLLSQFIQLFFFIWMFSNY